MEQRKDFVEAQIEMVTNALKKLLYKIRKWKIEGELQKEIIFESMIEIDNLSLQDLFIIEDRFLISTLKEKLGFTNEQIKILGNILLD